MFIVHSDTVVRVPPGTSPDYNSNNPLLKLLGVIQSMHLSAEREFYHPRSLQYLVPFGHLEMYGPQSPNSDLLEPELQDNKTDFQKQNVKDFITTDTHLARGWVTAGGWTGPFLKVSYDGSPDSKLYQAANGNLGPNIKLWMKVRDTMTAQLLRVPYNEDTDRYELEIWGYPGNDLRDQLDERGRAAFDQGRLIVRANLVRGNILDFSREGLDERDLFQVAPENTMHPVHSLPVELAWADDTATYWDSLDGANYRYEFSMIVRGWNNFISVGVSPNPHGGVGFLQYRNLLSNYGAFANSRELGQGLEPWMFNAGGTKDHPDGPQGFFAVDYMDLHIVQTNCAIGLHRHRDNQEVFFMLDGEALMVVGDWAQFPQRQRCFEARHLDAGHLAMLKGGNLHGLVNTTMNNVSLFMFGGYD